jgi:hypothetical protein
MSEVVGSIDRLDGFESVGLKKTAEFKSIVAAI